MAFENDELIKFYEPHNVLDLQNFTQSNPQDILDGKSITSTIRIISALILRIGFMLIQVGSIPIENAFMIIFRNIVETSISIMSYGFIGYHISFGRDTFHGIINYNGYIGDKDADYSAASLGFSSCLLGTAITSSLLVARLMQLPVLFLSFITSSVFLPMIICWCWSNSGWMTMATLLEERVSVKDFGGNLVVHVPSATIGFIGALFLGRRILKLQEVDKFSLGNEYASGIVTGYFFIMIGHLGLNLPSANYESRHALRDYIRKISINSLIAMGTGILIMSIIMMVITRDVYRYWVIVKCLQGGLAGLVIVSAGIDIYTPGIVVGVASAGSIILFLISNLIHHSALEDCCNIVPIYLICSSIGLLVPAILGNGDNLGFTIPGKLQMVHLLWQFLCLVIVVLLTSIIYLAIFTLLSICGILKNDNEVVNHRRAKILYGRVPWRRYLDRLFMVDNGRKELSPASDRDLVNTVST